MLRAQFKEQVRLEGKTSHSWARKSVRLKRKRGMGAVEWR